MEKTKKKIVQIDTSNVKVLDAFMELTSRLKKEEIAEVLESSIRTILRKEYGSDENFFFAINTNKGDIEVFKEKTIVDDFDITNEEFEVTLSTALLTDETAEIGDIFAEVFNLKSLSRVQLNSLKQILKQKIIAYEKGNIKANYENSIGNNIIGNVVKQNKYEYLIDHDNNTLVLRKDQCLPNEKFSIGETVKACIKDIVIKNNHTEICLSRTSKNYLKGLLEYEIREISSGEMEIISIARNPGKFSKVIVQMYDEWIDPIDIIKNRHFSSIKTIKKELNENIVFIKNSADLKTLMNRTLGVNTVLKAQMYGDTIIVWMKSKDFSEAIGSKGENIKLVSDLLGYKIQILNETEELPTEDVDLSEFSDEIDPIVITILSREGYTTAKEVLSLGINKLIDICEIDHSEAQDIIKILKEEFE
jgi:N utilization substance protein A